MLNRVGSSKPVSPWPKQSRPDDKRPGPSPHSSHPTGPAPPFDPKEEEPVQSDPARITGATAGRKPRR